MSGSIRNTKSLNPVWKKAYYFWDRSGTVMSLDIFFPQHFLIKAVSVSVFELISRRKVQILI